MIEWLHRLASAGRISWLSVHFAEFIGERDSDNPDEMLMLGAALVSEANQQGSACIQLDRLAQRPLFDLDPPAAPIAPPVREWSRRLLHSPCVGAAGEPAPLTLDRGRLYLNRYWRYETEVARQIRQRCAAAPARDAAGPESSMTLQSDRQRLDDDQRRAVLRSAQRHFCVISGGPGSGKTSTVVRILAVLLEFEPDMRVALTAPTGKAAARMLDSIERQIGDDSSLRARLPREATTLHRLLGYGHHRFRYGGDHHRPLDCIIVDEASMIDLRLMYHLLDALPPRARLIMLGDRDQLASVSAGSVLGDITGHGLDSESTGGDVAASLTLLRTSYRFAADSAIAELAATVNRGQADAAAKKLRSGSGLYWDASGSDSLAGEALEPVLNVYREVMASNEPLAALECFDRARVLCAVNFGARGVKALNERISEVLLADRPLVSANLYHGLPIMVLRNDYSLGLFNGDTGMLWQTGAGLRACFRDPEGNIRDITLNRLPEYAPAWAISVHKSQGSEFDDVLLVLPQDGSAEVLTRELLYTAITRAKSRFRLSASPAVFTLCVERLTRRQSGLASRLGWPDAGEGGGA